MKKSATGFSSSDGLERYYSDQATLVLSQYRAIENLLGPPENEWTWIGEHCESLFRTAIRRVLPHTFEIRKGYIHGTRVSKGRVQRCPEVDILVWDASVSPPILELENFVIVKPEAVRAVIQVKRTLSVSSLKDGIANIVQAKRHVLNTSRSPSVSSDLQSVFSAVLGIESNLKLTKKAELSRSYNNALKPHYRSPSDSWVMPDFVGSLNAQFLFKRNAAGSDPSYAAACSQQSEQNAAMMMLLYGISRKLLQYPELDDVPRSVRPFQEVKLVSLGRTKSAKNAMLLSKHHSVTYR